MRGKIKKNALIMSLIASFLAVTFAIAPAMAQIPTLAGPMIEDTALVPGSTFVADITISDVEAMLGYQFTLNWDSRILTATAVSSEYPFVYEVGKLIETGTLYMVFSYKLPELVGFYGTAVIAHVTFTVKGTGFSTLDLDKTEIAHITSDPIEHIVEDGYFTNEAVERRADLGKRRAYAEHPDWYLGKMGDSNTLTGLVKGLGSIPLKAKVEFSLTDGVTTVVFTTDEAMVSPKQVVRLSVTLTSADMFSGFATYYWTAKAYYDSDGDGTIDMAGLRIKTQHLDFMP